MATKKIAPRGKAGAPKLKTMQNMPKVPLTPPKKPVIAGPLQPQAAVKGKDTQGPAASLPQFSQNAMKRQVPNAFPGVKG